MKILVGLSDQHGQAWWRQVMPLSRLGPEHQVLFTDVADPEFFRSADLCVLSRISTTTMLDMLRMLVREGKPVVLDFDDQLHSMNSDNMAAAIYSSGKAATRIFEEALALPTVVTCSTRRLAADYAKWRPGIEVVENFLPNEVFDRLSPAAITGEPRREGEIRVGYAGSSTHGADLALIVRPLRKLCQKYHSVRLVFFGQEPPGLTVPYEHHPYVDPEPGKPFEFMDRYFETLRSLDLDVAIAPLAPNTFNAGKSFLKALEYGACGWPMVASSFGPYREYTARDGPIIPVYDEKEWLLQLSSLVRDQERRRDHARWNHAFVREHFTTDSGVAAWKRVIEKAVRESRALCGAG